jgi:hypothetical protein
MNQTDDCIERLNIIDGASASQHGEEISLTVSKQFSYRLAKNCNVTKLNVRGNVNFSKKLPDTIEYILCDFNYPFIQKFEENSFLGIQL